MKKYGFLFSGQGSQTQGMIKELCENYSVAKKTIQTISEITNQNIEDLLWNTENAELSRSDKSQLAITSVSQALMSVLNEKGITASATAGFSLGEFSALYASGVLDFETMIKIVQQRGEIMQKVCDAITASSADGQVPGMAAVLKLTPEQVIATLKPLTDKGIAFPVNMNSPMQTVISATAEGLAEAEVLCKEAGAKRVVKLAVAGPFHSPLMQKAADEFAKVLEPIEFKNPTIPLFANTTGEQVTDGAIAKQNAVLHITNPVLWTTIEKNLANSMNDGNDWKLFELGPGATLCGLWRDSGFAKSATNENGFTCQASGKFEETNIIIEENV